MSLPWGIGLPMIKVYSDETQTVLQRTLYLPPVDKRETRLVWKKKAIRKELVDGGERQRVLAYTPVLTLKWKVYPDLNHRGLGFGQADGNMLTLPDLQEVLALGSGRLRVCPGLSKATRVASLSSSGTGDGITLAYQLQGIVDGRTVPARKFPSPPTIYRTDWQGTYQLYSTARTNYIIRSQDFSTGWANQFGGTGVTPVRTANYGLAPDGTMTATRIQVDRGTGTTNTDISYVSSTGYVPIPGQKYRISLWMKTVDGSTQTVYFDSSWGSQTGNATINGTWQRVHFYITPNSTVSLVLRVGVRGTYGGQTADFLAWGAQIEFDAGTNAPTSYIPTGAAAVTVTDYSINSAGMVTLASTTNRVASQNLGTASGSTATFPVVTPNGSTPTVLAVWRTDWQGRQRMYPTARTNLLIRSTWVGGPPATGWTATFAGTGTYTQTASTLSTADGASAILFDCPTPGDRAIYQSTSMTTTGGQPYAASVFVEAQSGGVTAGDVILQNTAGATITYPVCEANPSGGINGLIQPGRLTAIITPPSTSLVARFGLGVNVGITSAKSVRLSRPQVEPGSAATSYIPTTTAAVTVTDWSQSASNVVFASNPLAGAVIEADYSYVGGLGVGNTLTWSGTFQDVAVGFAALVTKEPDYLPVAPGRGGDVVVEFTGRDPLSQPILADF